MQWVRGLLMATAVAALGACTSMGWHTYARNTAPAAKPTQLASARSSDPLICREDTGTGSLLPHRECHTQRQWDDLAQGNMDKFNQDAARSAAAMNPAGLSPPRQ